MLTNRFFCPCRSVNTYTKALEMCKENGWEPRKVCMRLETLVKIARTAPLGFVRWRNGIQCVGVTQVTVDDTMQLDRIEFVSHGVERAKKE